MFNLNRFNIESGIPDSIEKIDLTYGYPDVFLYKYLKVDEDKLSEETITKGYTDTSFIRVCQF